MTSREEPTLPSFLQWTAAGRIIVFVLAATSIWCLLAEMYGLMDMRSFFFAILVPATGLLYGLAVLDRLEGDRRLWRAVLIGTVAGLAGAAAYDIFRLPFVFSSAWGLDAIGVPQMDLFKVFPRFGAMILGQPLDQGAYSLEAYLAGWAYHFSNGATFGVMFAAIAAGAREAFAAVRQFEWRQVAWAVVMAAGIELCLLASPYASFFDLELSPRFVTITLVAHLVFGIGLGLAFAAQAKEWRLAGL